MPTLDGKLTIDDRVCHRKDDRLTGTVRQVEDNGSHYGDMCMVEWDGEPELDLQWCYKLVLVESER